MTSIYDLSWGETSFRSKLKLFFRSQEDWKLKDPDRWRQAEGCSALASTYHSIYGTAFAQLKAILRLKKWWLAWLMPIKLLVWCLTWLPLALWCYSRALPLSNRVVELMGGYGKMSAGTCDICQSVLRSHFKYAKAKECITEALNKPSVRPHTRGLLRVGLAEIYRREESGRRRRNKVRREVYLALAAAKEAERTEPRQAARIYRHCARLTDSIKRGDTVQANLLRQKAARLAQATGAKDQLLKI